MTRIVYTCAVAATLLLSGCRHEIEQVYPPEMEPYVSAFFLQAHLRGYDLYEEHFNFTIRFGETHDPGVAASCETPGRIITINPEIWASRGELEKEWIVFHELGHCILGRKHRNEESSTSECYSFMKGAENDFDCSINYFSEYWRDYYLDELFDQHTALPEWYLENQDYAKALISYPHYQLITDTLVEKFDIDTFRFKGKDTFLFEIVFHNLNSPVNAVLMALGNLKFSSCDKCLATKTSLFLGNDRIYASADISLNTDVKLSIFRNNDIVSFYVNEYFVHAMEYDLIEGNTLKTNTFEEPLRLDIAYYYH